PAAAAQVVDRALELAVPVGPAGVVEVLPAGAVPGQPGEADGGPGGGQVLGPRPEAPRRAAEAVAEQHADLAAVGSERLRAGQYAHNAPPVAAALPSSHVQQMKWRGVPAAAPGKPRGHIGPA